MLGLLLIAGVAWWVYQRPQPAATRGPRFGQPPVATAPVQSGDINVTINALGTVTSLATVTIRSQISGQIVRVAFTEGQLVNKGNLLVEIDSRPYQLALAQAEGALKQHQALLQAAQPLQPRARRRVVVVAAPFRNHNGKIRQNARGKHHPVAECHRITPC